MDIKPIGSLFMRYMIPSVVSMVTLSFYNIVDQYFIARGVGFIGNSATAAAFPLVTLTSAIAHLIGSGAAVLISLKLGKNDVKSAGYALGNSTLLLITTGTMVMVGVLVVIEPLLRILGATEQVMPYAVDYVTYITLGFPFAILGTGLSNIIRADGAPRYSMMSMLVGVLLNIILNPLFIFTFDMGVKGAAIATSVSQAASCGICLYYVLRRGQHIHLTNWSLRPDRTVIRGILTLGSSSFFTQMAFTIVIVVLNNSITYYGALSIYGAEMPLAAVGILVKINAIFTSIIQGIAIGAQPILGHYYGAEKFERVRKTYLLMVGISLLIALIGNLIFVFAPESLIYFFRDTEAVFNQFAARAMRIFLSCFFCVGISIPSAVYFQSVGRPWLATLLVMVRQIVVLVTCVLLLPLLLGLDGILYAGPITDLLSLLLTVVFVLHELRVLQKKIEQNEFTLKQTEV